MADSPRLLRCTPISKEGVSWLVTAMSNRSNLQSRFRPDSFRAVDRARLLPLVALPVALLCLPLHCNARTPGPPQDSPARFELHGKVINIVTGEPVAGALVRICCPELTQFSAADGTFRFTDMSRGQRSVSARKPGFFAERELHPYRSFTNENSSVPAAGPVVVYLIPEAVIFGEVKSENGEPLEDVQVAAQRMEMVDGRQIAVGSAYATTNDLGEFRMAELKPGSYFVLFVPSNEVGQVVRSIGRMDKIERGYVPEFYPGAADRSAATPIVVRPGARIGIRQMLGLRRLFRVSGVVRGADPEQPFNVTLLNEDGDGVQYRARSFPETGVFQMREVPPGTYLLQADGRRLVSGRAPESWKASLPLTVNDDLSGLVLSLSPPVSVSALVRDERLKAVSGEPPPVMVRLIPRRFARFGPTIALPPPPGATNHPAKLDVPFAGSFGVFAWATGDDYVSELRCGDTDLLHEDLVIAPGTVPPPIEVTVRDDGAQLHISLQGDEPAFLVVYSAEFPVRSQLITPSAEFNLSQIPPGNYQVFAFDGADALDPRDPAEVEPYLDHATNVTLHPGGLVSLRLSVQKRKEPQP